MLRTKSTWLPNLNQNATLALALLVFVAFQGCRKKTTDDSPGEVRDGNSVELQLTDPEVKERWILKASRKLRHGAEPSEEEFKAWRKLPPTEVLNQILESPDAKEGGLDFILFFLGFKDDSLYMPTGKPMDLTLSFDASRSKIISDISMAVESALFYNRNEDFMKPLTELKGRYFASPLPHGTVTDQGVTFDFTSQLRSLVDRIHRAKALMDQMAAANKIDPEICKISYKFNQDSNSTVGLLHPVLVYLAYIPLSNLSYLFSCAERAAAANNPNATPISNSLPNNFATYHSSLTSISQALARYESEFSADKYMPRKLEDLKPFEFEKTQLSQGSEYLSRSWFWQRVKNSSTNRNRKRAAYVLKRFFCDDLTPIGVETPAQHAGDQHASDPGCASCHYKLDPMAGFFRKIGANGTPVTTENYGFINFDDNASQRSKEYFESWKGSDGTYDIGYIRSRSDVSQNTYPEHRENPEFSDLATLLRTAPEVQRCLVKRAFQYLVGEEVALDRGYQEELEGVYNSNSKQTSTVALKSVLKTVALSNSFLRDSSERGVCYDYPKNYDAKGKPACEINYVVEQNCSGTCHSKASAAGGLDMSSWNTPTAASAPGGFLHTNQSNGQSLSYAESLTRIAERLNTTDDKLRMPLSMTMNPVDRETLYLWTQSQLRSVK